MSKENCLILDACCGAKMMWFDKSNPLTVFNDVREIETTLCDGREFTVKPDILSDFTELNFSNSSFKLVVFDPPHLNKIGDDAWMAIKYGKLPLEWNQMIERGFSECFRVLEDDGILIFKWNELQIKTSEVLKCAGYRPLFGHPSGKRSDTHWIVFMKNQSFKKSISCMEAA
ncbi:SAM-dependent methyltransferase [Vibrio cincinnatiensis]|uniref:SAM-dependent methyltransferase n=1 Tax=Vibrio cincinnatiensis TaxID=675 RepID=UPI001FA9A548|nr:SAM-dependent methyltransferase [Vibrio cincinnatiensis]